MNVLIVEDEPRAANRLARLILDLRPQCTVLAKISSVDAALRWLDSNAAPDLIFMDVRLEDGDSFEILSRRQVDTPVIFCTAYSDYALRAFGVNSIDYLLKPVVRGELSRALAKYARFAGFRVDPSDWPDFPPEQQAATAAARYRQQFIVALAGTFTPVKTADLVAAGSYLKGAQLVDRHGRRWILDDSLAKIEDALDPAEFVRISRQWLIRLSAVQSLKRTAGGYVLNLDALQAPLTVSRSRVSLLKKRLAC